MLNANLQITLSRHQLPAPFLEFFMRFITAVMEGAENLVPGHFKIAIVTFKVAMMHLMMEISQVQAALVFHQHAFKPGMRGGSCQALVEEMKQNMRRMGGNEKMNEDR